MKIRFLAIITLLICALFEIDVEDLLCPAILIKYKMAHFSRGPFPNMAQ